MIKTIEPFHLKTKTGVAESILLWISKIKIKRQHSHQTVCSCPTNVSGKTPFSHMYSGKFIVKLHRCAILPESYPKLHNKYTQTGEAVSFGGEQRITQGLIQTNIHTKNSISKLYHKKQLNTFLFTGTK